MEWWQYPRVDNFGAYPDPVGNYPKPDSNIDAPAGTPITALAAGTVTSVRLQPWAPRSWSITIRLDKPYNTVATHTAYNYVSNPAVSSGQHVSIGDKLAVAGNPYNVGTAFAFTDSDVYGTATKNEPFSGTYINPALNPVPFLDSIKGGTVAGTPLTLRAFMDSVLNDLSGGYNSSQNIINFMISWGHHEGGSQTNDATFNPLNTMQTEPGSTQAAGLLPGIQSYPDGTTGIKATVDALKNGNYPSLVHALSIGDENNLGFNGHPMAANIAGDLSVWVSGKRTPLAQSYILAIMAGAGIPGAYITGGNASGPGSGTPQSTIDEWANVSLGEDTNGVTVGGAANNAFAGLQNINAFFGQLSAIFSDPSRIIKVLGGAVLIIAGVVLAIKNLAPIKIG